MKYLRYKNIVVIPIPCAEYYALATLVLLHDIDLCHSYDSFIDCFKNSDSIHYMSFERICKLALKEQKECKHNKIIRNDCNAGMYWINSCRCSECVTASLLDLKMRKFLQYFPVKYDSSTKSCTIDYNHLEAIYERLKQHYSLDYKDFVILRKRED